jgi:hypothetical protein
VVTQDDVELRPIGLLWALRPEAEAAMTDLDDRIIGVVIERDQPRPDAERTLRHTQRVHGKLTFFEVSTLIAALRSLLATPRPLRPSDLVAAAGPALRADRERRDTPCPRLPHHTHPGVNQTSS